MITCLNCQTALALDAVFCPECGTSTNSTAFQNSNSNENKFTSFIAPVLESMDKGNFLLKPMQWLFAALAVSLLISPFRTIYKLKEAEVFANASVFALLLSIFCLFMGWIGFQIWWSRKKYMAECLLPQDEFKAIPLFSYFLQTIGEWYGAYVAIMGVGATIATFFLTKETSYFISFKLKTFFIILPDIIDFSSFGGLILSVLGGFLILIVFRYLAEFIRAIAAIANNTKRNN